MRRQLVGRNVGRMGPIWRVIAEITPMRRLQCVGRNASVAMSRPRVGRNAADYAQTLKDKSCLNYTQ